MGDNFQLFCGQSAWNLCEQRQDNWQDKEKFPRFWSFFIIFTQFYPYFLTFCRYFAYFSTFTPIILNWKIYNRAKGYWNDKDFLKKLSPMGKSVPDNFV